MGCSWKSIWSLHLTVGLWVRQDPPFPHLHNGPLEVVVWTKGSTYQNPTVMTIILSFSALLLSGLLAWPSIFLSQDEGMYVSIDSNDTKQQIQWVNCIIVSNIMCFWCFGDRFTFLNALSFPWIITTLSVSTLSLNYLRGKFHTCCTQRYIS